jgi:stage V sporulation protein S
MRMDTVEEHIRVGSDSSPQNVAASATAVMMKAGTPKLRAIGAGAVNQAIKAAIIARSNMAQRGVDVVVRPGFVDLQGKDGEVSGIELSLLRTDSLG